MDRPPGVRALALDRFFSRQYGFRAEKHILGNTIYIRRLPSGRIDRIVTKHIPVELAPRGRLDDEIIEEEKMLRRLWGSEHNVQLLAVTDDLRHVGARWNKPENRIQSPYMLPWRLQKSKFKSVTGFRFFVMEYLPGGTGLELMERCAARNVAMISQPLLWSFFLCLARACVGITYPPSRKDRNPAEVWREELPVVGQRRSRIMHRDIHLGNVMFDEYDIRNIIDFGMVESGPSATGAQKYNIMQIGTVIQELALLVEDESKLLYSIQVDDLVPEPYDTFAPLMFYNDARFDLEFRVLVARCMAVSEKDRPSLRHVFDTCERHVAQTQDWAVYEDEVKALFEMPDNWR
ncbi:hypothetical protein GGR58DRAFT_524165 [Xylaria digitata]|nr:hypothetical protein GGR58DRAFT_524165 [Xylaria digitata]